MKRHPDGRVNIQINPGDNFEEKLKKFLEISNRVLNHPKNKPLKIKKSFLKKI